MLKYHFAKFVRKCFFQTEARQTFIQILQNILRTTEMLLSKLPDTKLLQDSKT